MNKIPKSIYFNYCDTCKFYPDFCFKDNPYDCKNYEKKILKNDLAYYKIMENICELHKSIKEISFGNIPSEKIEGIKQIYKILNNFLEIEEK